MRPSLIALLALVLSAPAFAAPQPEVIIEDPNDFSIVSPVVLSVATSDAAPDGSRLLVWVDQATKIVFARLLDARTNAALGNIVRLTDTNTTFSHVLPGTSGPPINYSFELSNVPGQPRAFYHPAANQWLVLWPAKLRGDGGGSMTFTGTHLVGRTVSREGDELVLGEMRHLTARWQTESGLKLFNLPGIYSDGYFDVAFDPAQERYVLVWSSSIEGTSNLYVCLLDATGLPLPECNGPRMAATNWDASIAVTTLLDDSHTPSRLVVTFAKTAGIAPSVRTKVVNADLTNLDEDTGAEVYAVNGEWLTIILDKPHDRIIHANSPAHTQGPFLYEQALGSFPGGPIRSLPLRNVSGLNQQWQPEFKVMPSADLLLMRTEQFGAGG